MSSQISAKILADSINVATGDRLTTFQIRCGKFLLQEINTHRQLSKNFSSARAIPAKVIRKQVLEDPYIPAHFGANQKGMQADRELSGLKLFFAKQVWLKARLAAVAFHWLGEKIGLHKQVLNRICEPFVWADGVISGTDWDNFFKLRYHKDAMPDFFELAKAMFEAKENSIPEKLHPGEWHLPFVHDIDHYGTAGLTEREYTERLCKTSAARCARVSFLLRDGKKSDIASDIALCDRLFGSDPKHLSPAEHVAIAVSEPCRIANFSGFKQYRKFIEE